MVCSICVLGGISNSTCLPCDLIRNCKFYCLLTAGYDIEQTLLTTVFPSSADVSKPEIGTPDFRIVYEFLGAPATNDMTGFHDVTSIGNRQGQIDVLFNQQNCHALAADRCQRIHQLFHDDGRQSQTHLVDHQQNWSRHQSTSHRAHLLFASRQASSDLTPALRQ